MLSSGPPTDLPKNAVFYKKCCLQKRNNTKRVQGNDNPTRGAPVQTSVVRVTPVWPRRLITFCLLQRMCVTSCCLIWIWLQGENNQRLKLLVSYVLKIILYLLNWIVFLRRQLSPFLTSCVSFPRWGGLTLFEYFWWMKKWFT